jgi:hypothetical protein
MTRKNLDTFLGYEVRVTCTDGDVFSGILFKGERFEKGLYQCDDGVFFRASHVKKVEHILTRG